MEDWLQPKYVASNEPARKPLVERTRNSWDDWNGLQIGAGLSLELENNNATQVPQLSPKFISEREKRNGRARSSYSNLLFSDVVDPAVRELNLSLNPDSVHSSFEADGSNPFIVKSPHRHRGIASSLDLASDIQGTRRADDFHPLRTGALHFPAARSSSVRPMQATSVRPLAPWQSQSRSVLSSPASLLPPSSPIRSIAASPSPRQRHEKENVERCGNDVRYILDPTDPFGFLRAEKRIKARRQIARQISADGNTRNHSKSGGRRKSNTVSRSRRESELGSPLHSRRPKTTAIVNPQSIFETLSPIAFRSLASIPSSDLPRERDSELSSKPCEQPKRRNAQKVAARRKPAVRRRRLPLTDNAEGEEFNLSGDEKVLNKARSKRIKYFEELEGYAMKTEVVYVI